MSPPHIAIVSENENFDPATHARRDLDVLDLEISQAESELALARLRVRNPRAPISSILDRRVFISESGVLIFAGRFSYVPRGAIDATVDVEATARPDDLDAAISAAIEPLKTAPFYDPLFVPQGSEGDPAEVLAGYSSVLAYSRTDGSVSVVDALSGAETLTIVPLEGSVDYDYETVAAQYSISLTARWSQLLLYRDRDDGIFRDLTTLSPDQLIESFPRVGASIGDGWSVTHSLCEIDSDEDTEVIERLEPVGADEMDPAWIAAGDIPIRGVLTPITAQLGVEYRGEVNRTETVNFSISAGLQTNASTEEIENEIIDLRDITSPPEAAPWQPSTDYLADDQVIDGSNVYRARVDHTSGSRFDSEYWVLIGETAYLSSRRAGSFFQTERGQAAVDHALERIRARARIAARSVRVSFEAAMPQPEFVTENTAVTLAHPRIPGGSITGRLIDYTLSWSGGARTMRGTIAACAGTGSADTAAATVSGGDIPFVSVGSRVRIEGRGSVQKSEFDAGRDVPTTRLIIETTPPAATDIQQSAEVTAEGEISIPSQANI